MSNRLASKASSSMCQHQKSTKSKATCVQASAGQPMIEIVKPANSLVSRSLEMSLPGYWLPTHGKMNFLRISPSLWVCVIVTYMHSAQMLKGLVVESYLRSYECQKHLVLSSCKGSRYMLKRLQLMVFGGWERHGIHGMLP